MIQNYASASAGTDGEEFRRRVRPYRNPGENALDGDGLRLRIGALLAQNIFEARADPALSRILLRF